MKSMNKVAWWFGVVALVANTGCGASDGWPEGEDIAEAEEHLDETRFTGWEPIQDKVFNSAPALVNAGTNGDTLDVYARGTDDAIHRNFFSPVTGVWSGWSSIGGAATSKPAATIAGTQRFVVVKGTDNAVWINRTTGSASGFVGWARINATGILNAPSITYMNPHLFVAARRSDNKVYWMRNDISGGYSNANWTAWNDIPIGAVQSAPAITAKDGTLVVTAQGTDDAFWLIHSTNNGNTWASSWKKVGAGIFKDAPAIAFHGSNVELAGRGTDDFMWVATANPTTGVTGGWSQIPFGIFTSAGAIEANVGSSNGKLAVAGKGTDNRIWINRWQ